SHQSKSLRNRRDRGGGRRRCRGRLEQSFQRRAGCGLLVWRRRRGFDLFWILNVPPLATPRRLTVASPRAPRITEWQPHFECEIRAQEVRKVGAVRAKDEPHLVFAETEIVEQEITRPIAQHLVQRRPGGRRVERRIEELFYPRREEVFGRAIPS